MAGGSLLALLDDITTVLDDVSLMAKVAAKKTAGVLGDDLALNAEQVAGIQAERELPVVWAVTKGSFLNKLILVPIALLLSAFLPWLITPLLMLGGAYLCYEGFEKILHKLLHGGEEEIDTEAELLQVSHNPEADMVAFEKEKIKGAIRTDFVLSAEIIVIALGTVKDASFLMQAIVVAGIAVVMTIGVYGAVAGIVKLDDAGFYLLRDKASAFKQALGRGLLAFAPWLMKALSVVGTAAMFLVGGGILLHGIPHSHEFLHGAELFVQQVGGIGGLLAAITPTLLNGLFGVLAGAVTLAVAVPVSNLISKFRQPS
ncbi:DUF808 domain-containing protein [Candidatus Thiothrix sp. Deng01]|uniref:DUF808 domain-containing protein n=1 Tax=Candidatus Thiothrix phosphatis TaxID=3112415 RepID=A0ABU6CUD2_9GAMM|nr:DUF808 domain-containing protein [Candidatus Thiothrix sp. Deng01]MEB4590445.1 DUF808 domain-containing protein [Candidatus Thiothrix sp. Deng01]